MPDSSHVVNNHSVTLSLRHIKSPPVDFGEPLYAQYSGMKMGLANAVAFYAECMLERVLALMAQHDPEQKWVLTGPPIKFAPSGANLITWQLYKRLKQHKQYSNKIELLDLRLPDVDVPVDSQADFDMNHNYCSANIAQRIHQRAQEYSGQDDILNNRHVFDNRAVIVINDIKVTGTQQQFMQRSFDQLNINGLWWLYIFSVDNTLAESCPQLESNINYSKNRTLTQFQQLLLHSDMTLTSKCIARMFSLEQEDFGFLIRDLSKTRQAQVLELALGEKRYSGQYFAPKFAMLRELVDER